MLDALGPCSHREDSNSTNNVNYTTNSTGSNNSTNGNNNDNDNGTGNRAAISACRSMALWTESHSVPKHKQMVGQVSS